MYSSSHFQRYLIGLILVLKILLCSLDLIWWACQAAFVVPWSCQLQAVNPISFRNFQAQVGWSDQPTAQQQRACTAVGCLQSSLTSAGFSRAAVGCTRNCTKKAQGATDGRGTGRHNCGLKIVAPPNRICHYINILHMNHMINFRVSLSIVIFEP